MKKAVFTLCVDDYSVAITNLTFPYLKAYAEKIGAEFRVITKRKSPQLPACMEKLQIYELGREYDWSIYIDADCLLHPDFFDVTEICRPGTVMHVAKDFALDRYRYDKYFRRDGRHISSCNWFAVAPNDCLDLWHPLDDISLSTALAAIYPISRERLSGLDATNLLDDYTLSRNIARFGLKFETLQEASIRLGMNGEYFWHPFPSANFDADLKKIGIETLDGVTPAGKKVLMMRHKIGEWKLGPEFPPVMKLRIEEMVS